MSIVAPSIRRRWLPIAAGLTALALAATLSAVIFNRQGDVSARSPGRSGEAPAVPALPQADWVVRSYPAGIKGKPAPAVRNRTNRAARAIAATLDEVYLATFLEPATLDPVLEQHFSRPAARRFQNAGLTSAGARDVRFTRRLVSVGVEGLRARRAAATTDLTVVGVREDERFRIRHRATMWLERSNGSWRVIAFQVNQRPKR